MSALTEKALAASLKKLLRKKTLDKITVKDITNDCGVNRQTFYYHFHDVYDLVEWIFTEEAKNYMYDGLNVRNWRDVISDVMNALSEDKEFVINTFYSLTRRQLEEFVQKLVRPAISDIASQVSEGMNIRDDDREFVVDISLYALTGILAEWIADGMDSSYQERLDKLFTVLDGMLESALSKFAEG